jgi:hypothetical protein
LLGVVAAAETMDHITQVVVVVREKFIIPLHFRSRRVFQ